MKLQDSHHHGAVHKITLRKSKSQLRGKNVTLRNKVATARNGL